MQEDTDKANKHSSVLERDNQRMEVQIKDLSQQVSFLFLFLFYFVFLNCLPSNVCFQVCKIELVHTKFSSTEKTALNELQSSHCLLLAPPFFLFFKHLINFQFEDNWL